MNRTRIQLIIAMAALLAAGIGLGHWWAGRTAVTPVAERAAGDEKILYWYDPMVPEQHFDKPGKSPFMDMQLVPRYADEAGAGSVAVAPEVQQSLGIRTVRVERGSLGGAVSVPGTIGWDLRREHVVSARVDAVIERLFVKAPYQSVRAGQPLVAILAPVWSTALAEAHALGQADSAPARALQSASRARLRALGVPPGASDRGGILLTAPISGVVTEIGAREGAMAPAGTLLLRINGTATVWLEAALPQAAVAGIGPSTVVEARVDALPGRVFAGRVETLLPQIAAGSRTQPARVVLDNPNGVLVPGMFARIELHTAGDRVYPLVPSDAVIGSGSDARVFVQGQGGRFHPQPVQTGRSVDGFTEIRAGLDGGERVVASGQFLLDSEASLSGALERLGADPASGPGRPNEAATPHEGHDPAPPESPSPAALGGVRPVPHEGHDPAPPESLPPAVPDAVLPAPHDGHRTAPQENEIASPHDSHQQALRAGDAAAPRHVSAPPHQRPARPAVDAAPMAPMASPVAAASIGAGA